VIIEKGEWKKNKLPTLSKKDKANGKKDKAGSLKRKILFSE
jgi:hypothetical protein